MNQRLMYLLLACVLMCFLGVIATKCLDRCDHGFVRYQALGADICVEAGKVALLRCLETKVSQYDGQLVRKNSGGFELQIANAKFTPEFGGSVSQGGTIRIVPEHLAEAIESCKQLGGSEGVHVQVDGSSGTSINIQVSK